MKKCWAETAFISLLIAGIFLGVYVFLILIGRFMRIHTAETIMPVFSELPAPFLISAAVLLLTAYVICAPLYFGIRWFYWQASGGQIMPLSSLFACYSSRESIFRCIKLKFIMDMQRFIFTAIFGGLGALGSFLAFRIWHDNDNSRSSGILLICLCTIMFAGLTVLYTVFTVKYVPVGYLMADNPYSGTGEILTLSRRIVGKRYYHMLMFYLSCANYVAMCIFIFPVLLVYPMLCMFTAVYIRDGLYSDEYSRTDTENEPTPEKAEVSV